MKYDLILIRYSEIGLKGNQTRKNFERILTRNVNINLKKMGIQNEIKNERGRIFLKTKEINKTLEILKKIFGIKSFSPVLKTKADMDSISLVALKLAKIYLKKNQSFAIISSRTGNHNFSSMDVAVEAGNAIVKEMGNKVDLTNPDFKLYIDIRDKSAYLFTEKIFGPGGLPLGSQGNVLTLVDNPESLLAAWFLMKRGCINYFFIYDSNILELTKNFCEKWFNISIIKEIDYKKSTAHLNDFVSKKNCSAVVVNNCIYDSNNTLDEILFLKQKISVPVLHPLIIMKPSEITKKLSQIEVL